MAARKRAPKRKPDWGPRFLESLRTTRMVTTACQAAEVGRSTAYDRRERDDEFRQAWDDVEAEVTDALEREAYRRAALGTERDIYHQGEVVGTERLFSDTLLIFLLKARKPNVYRDNVRHEHTGPEGGPVRHDVDVRSPKVREHLDAALKVAAEAERAPRRD